jgi:hypothetical protein
MTTTFLARMLSWLLSNPHHVQGYAPHPPILSQVATISLMMKEIVSDSFGNNSILGIGVKTKQVQG